MPKIKTRRAAAKRFKVTKTGKVFHMHAKRKHLLYGKSSGLKRHLGKKGVVKAPDMKRIRRMISI